MAAGNGKHGKDPFATLLKEVEELKFATRDMNDRMEVLADRMDSMSETMSELAKTMGVMGKSMAALAVSGRQNEKLYTRLAGTLIAFKDQSDDRFDAIEQRLDRIERKTTRH